MNIEKPSFKKICLMHIQALTNFPYIEKDFDAITDYELISKVVDYLNQVIANSNEQNTAITDLYDAFIELKDYVDNYFDNNFPELVSDKLDEMAEDGTLENLLNNRLKLITTYHTFRDVVEDKESLVNGLIIKTLGYYTINDGGAATYYITNTASETDYQEDFDNGLYGTLIVKDKVNVLQLGAKNDGSEDVSNILNSALTYYKNIYFPIGKYLVNNTINLENKNGVSLKGENYGGNNNNTSILVGNTGNDPIIDLLGALNISIEDLFIYSSDNTETPSILGILQGCTETSQYSQWINFKNLHINLISDSTANDNNGSICVYNYQSELNSYINCFFYSDLPFVAVSDDDFGIASSFGAVLPSHDSLTGNTYTNLETQSKLKYCAYMSGTGITMTGFYGQGTLKLATNARNDNQLNNFTIIGVVENNNTSINDYAIELGTSVKLQSSLIQLSTVHFTNYIGSATNTTVLQSIIKFSGNLTGEYSTNTVQFVNNVLFKKSNINITNANCVGNAILGGDIGTVVANNNLSLINDGTLLINGKAVLMASARPTRTDLPSGSIAFNMQNNYFTAWKYSSSLQSWREVGIGRAVETTTANIASEKPVMVGQILLDASTNDLYMAYGTNTGEWKKIS